MPNLYLVELIRTTRERYEVYANDEIEAEDVALDVAHDSSEDAIETEQTDFFVDDVYLEDSEDTEGE